MSANTYRIPTKQAPKRSIFSALERFLHIDSSLGEVIHVRFLPQILFISFLTVIYIGNKHNAEKKIREIHILERQVEDLRADFTTLTADFMFASKQSEVAKRAARLGLKPTVQPPKKLIAKP